MSGPLLVAFRLAHAEIGTASLGPRPPATVGGQRRLLGVDS